MRKARINPFTVNDPELDLHGETTFATTVLVRDFIYDNVKLRNKEVIIVHGKGTGVLKKHVQELLKHNKNVVKYYIDGTNDGATIVELKY